MDDLTADSRSGLDEALFILAPEGLGSAQSALGRTRLRTFITLRWLAVAGQTAAVVFVTMVFGFQMQLALCLAIIASSAWLNVLLAFAFQSQRLTRGWEATLQLAFDTVQLAALIAATGGLSNPFLLLLLAPVTIAALSLQPARATLIAVLALVLAALMSVASLPLPWIDTNPISLPPLFQWGQLTALAVGVVFFSLSAVRVSQDEARLVRALDAASVVMAREQKLSALGAMSAMTTHELGTPLATIHLVSKELLGELSPDDPHMEDVRLIAEQADRCRTILATIREAREATDMVHALMPLDALVEEAAAPFKGLGVDLTVRAIAGERGEAKAPVLNRSPEILHALGAFIENAVSFAASRVDAVASWTDDQILITISDDGPGFAAEVMPKLGEPYVSQRSEAQLGGGDMGLGFFIAKTLIERTGGRIATRNRPLPKTGAIVQALWPRAALEASILSQGVQKPYIETE
ncbi:ActS/PrrB/RegB family redox-sensitive histidine kinase [Hyphomonas johnsonii]|uniref:histidine kinase n=1 Tax=Hyphomonas johnsonii MHS-2 TaxID=1280950 RepID=A0A059FNK7_9PROT|nr:ActS/PrrB/RegB family redox-sensitive histidine kinase [Hyphomonas johnsonii]KCZ92275.1 sensor histidine kinase [Hyphomonas johnsonii MHS-2]